jgi:hypothetical protein
MVNAAARHHPAHDWPMRWIAEAMTLSRRTVHTIVDKADGIDRSTVKRRIKLGLPTLPRPKRRKWNFAHSAKQADTLMEESRELIKEANGFGRVRAGS